MFSSKSSVVEKLMLALFFFSLVTLKNGTKRYIATYGKDVGNKCKKEMLPCRTIKHAILHSQDNDTIAIFSERSEIEPYKLNDQNDSILIEKSLHFVGIKGRPKLISSATEFSFLVSSTKSKTNLSLTNIHIITELQTSRKKMCKPSLFGMFLIKRADVSLINCTFEKVCSNIYVVGTEYGLTNINIVGCLFLRVHYIIFSKNSSLLTINVSSTEVVGEVGSKVPFHAISLIVKNVAFIHISNSRFYQLNEAVAISMHEKWLKLKISGCDFIQNSGQSILLSFSSTVNVENTMVELDNLQLQRNDGRYASSIHLIRSWTKRENFGKSHPKIHISRSKFIDNYAQAFFGTIYAEGVKLTIEESMFHNNTAGNRESSLQAFGGALFVESGTEVLVVNTKFVNNTCSGFGGTVFSRGSFYAVNCQFIGSSETAVIPLLGDILYATAGLHLENTSWYPRQSYRSISAIWHPGSPTLESWLIRIEGYFKAFCPVGHNITGYGISRHQKMLSDRISMGCKSCPREKYSLEAGSLEIFSKDGIVSSYSMRNATCFGCRYGGVCEHGRIKARSNYYGYELGIPAQIRFISCPVGYCCQGDQCRSYDSCSPTRKGRLCGRCINGSTENLLSSRCIEKENCNDIWFWVLYFPLGWVYIWLFMYLDKITVFLKQQLIWWESKIPSKHEGKCKEKEEHTSWRAETKESSTFEDIANHDSDDGDNVLSNDDSSTTALERSNANDIEEHLQNEDTILEQDFLGLEEKRGNDNQQDAAKSQSLNDVVNITFYFYQIILIVRDHDNAVLSNTVAMVKEISTSIFTFSLNAESSLALCPIDGLTPVTKSFLTRSFAFYVVALLFVINLINSFYNFACIEIFQGKELSSQTTLVDFNARLRVATIQIILLAYSTITNMIMSFVNCVQVGRNNVLYMDGSVTCFTWWQIILLLFIVSWLIPFPVALFLAIYQMRQDSASYNEFIVALAAPFIYIFYVVVRMNCCSKLRAENLAYCQLQNFYTKPSQKENVLLRKEDLNAELDTTSRFEILKRFETPFVTSNETISVKEMLNGSCPGYWPGVMIGRRLIIIMLSTFVNNPVTRLYSMLLACLLFLMHHLLSLPYKNNALNILETISSATLVLFCSMNLFFAYSYVSNVAPADADDRINYLFDLLEVLLLAILPASLLIILLFVLLLRILLLLIQLINAFLNFFRLT